MFNNHQKHRLLSLSKQEFLDFINDFKFSEEDSIRKSDVVELLSRFASEEIDLWYMRYETGENRSTTDYRINALLQGSSEGLNPTDENYYVGDRNLKTKNLSVQIHKVILKNHIDNQYKKGDDIYVLTFLSPLGYIMGNYVRKMSSKEIIDRLNLNY